MAPPVQSGILRHGRSDGLYGALFCRPHRGGVFGRGRYRDLDDPLSGRCRRETFADPRTCPLRQDEPRSRARGQLRFSSVLMLTGDSQIDADLRICADEKDLADFRVSAADRERLPPSP
jgi:hypothetical protein